jgi:hypothetical protein
MQNLQCAPLSLLLTSQALYVLNHSSCLLVLRASYCVCRTSDFISADKARKPMGWRGLAPAKAPATSASSSSESYWRPSNAIPGNCWCVAAGDGVAVAGCAAAAAVAGDAAAFGVAAGVTAVALGAFGPAKGPWRCRFFAASAPTGASCSLPNNEARRPTWPSGRLPVRFCCARSRCSSAYTWPLV